MQGGKAGSQVTVNGWLRTRRDSSGFSFLEINDGSCLANIQVIAEKGLANYESEIKKLTTGCSAVIRGELKESPAKGQRVEIVADTIEVVGWADPENYPLQKKRHSFEFLRDISHLRPRTNALGGVARVRSRLSYAIHEFFHHKGFHQIHTPVITTSDCEGAGEMFQVVTEQEFKEGYQPSNELNSFFGSKAGLTVSGQLQAEVFAQALGSVYTFGPTFRAENSHTSRHLAEFWMLEPEMAFCNLDGLMEIEEEFVSYIVQRCLRDCAAELAVLERDVSRLQDVTPSFPRIHYDEAVDMINKAAAAGELVPGYDDPVPSIEWGEDFDWDPDENVDGGYTTQPEYAFWFQDVGWSVENHGVDPDIYVDNMPEDLMAGGDPQLEKAVEVALGLLEREGVELYLTHGVRCVEAAAYLDAGRDLYEKLLFRSPETYRFRSSLGLVHALLGNSEEAIVAGIQAAEGDAADGVGALGVEYGIPCCTTVVCLPDTTTAYADKPGAAIFMADSDVRNASGGHGRADL